MSLFVLRRTVPSPPSEKVGRRSSSRGRGDIPLSRGVRSLSFPFYHEVVHRKEFPNLPSRGSRPLPGTRSVGRLTEYNPPTLESTRVHGPTEPTRKPWHHRFSPVWGLPCLSRVEVDYPWHTLKLGSQRTKRFSWTFRLKLPSDNYKFTSVVKFMTYPVWFVLCLKLCHIRPKQGTELLGGGDGGRTRWSKGADVQCWIK